MDFFRRSARFLAQSLSKLKLDMRTKLIIIFVIINTIPLILLTVIALMQFRHLARELHLRSSGLKAEASVALTKMGDVAIADSMQAINDMTIIQFERTSTDIARQVAEFLYDRDDDILYAAELPPGEDVYRRFMEHKSRPVVKESEWVLAEDGKSWIAEAPLARGLYSPSSNNENNTMYHNRPADLWEMEERPLYLEMTYIDTAGNEIIKITSSGQMDGRKKNVSNRLNTYIKAETYFPELKNLKPGEIYVSDVIGAYTPSRLIGMYTPENTAARGIPFVPEEEAYAGKENPNGRRFKGIVRWATPVVRDGRVAGYVTLALDHDHIMEFVDHVTPMDERYTAMPSAFEGNYAFIWDYKCRSICHPRHHSIAGFNPETGEPEVPWLEDRIYNEWQASGLSYTEFIKDVPVFFEQSRSKNPAPELTAAGLVGLDGRYLNNAPQCTGWMDLTKNGGSGSFLILWSGIWKPNTAAAIPYYTGNYGNTRRGFGFVAIGAGLEDFQRPARETEKEMVTIITGTDESLSKAAAETDTLISNSLGNTTAQLAFYAVLMLTVIVFTAILLASTLTSSITNLINGISRFRAGERHFRFNPPIKDEIGTLALSFDEMADSLNKADRGPIIIINNDMNVLYANEPGLTVSRKTLDEVLGRPYAEMSIYPANSVYDPIAALRTDRETEIMFDADLNCYFKGEASYMKDKDGRNIGYVITSADVTEMMEQQEKLEQAVEEAKRANEHKGNFLARMSHEIRTPMNAIIGMTNIVKKKLETGGFDLGDVRGNIDQIETSSHHLLGLLNDILDVSKIEAGKIELFIEDIDLLKLAQTVVTIIRPRCEEKSLTFETRFDIPSGKLYRADALRLRQVLINLLGNAVKFTPEFGKILFTIEKKRQIGEQAFIDFVVGDTGIGIPEHLIGSLFKPFQQADSQIAQKYGGTGLGLGISKSIVQLFGSDITVKSDVGKGSKFSFSLLLEENEAGTNEEIHTEDASGRLRGKRALLVDDVDINRIIAINMLETTGIEVDEAEDGTVALKMFGERPENTYDIIYMDVQMPEMNGYEAAEAIRALDRPDAKTVPIVALTANAFKEDIDKALASGMNAHLAKPLDMEKVITITLKLLEM